MRKHLNRNQTRIIDFIDRAGRDVSIEEIIDEYYRERPRVPSTPRQSMIYFMRMLMRRADELGVCKVVRADDCRIRTKARYKLIKSGQ